MDEILGKIIDFCVKLSIFKFFDNIKIFSGLTGFIKDKEKSIPIIKYLICGVITTVFSMVSFWLLIQTPLNENVANLISIVASVIVAYVLNRVYVFLSTEKNILKEFSKFAIARAGSAVFDLIIFFVFVTLLHFDEMIVKFIIQIVVIILNYIFSKLFVFTSKTKEEKNWMKN